LLSFAVISQYPRSIGTSYRDALGDTFRGLGVCVSDANAVLENLRFSDDDRDRAGAF
jgi:hypothetical protein